jgi:hypothetical protein
MGEVYTNQTFYDMMENENPVLQELELRLGFTSARKKEVQFEIHRIHERIATEVLTPLISPRRLELKVPKYRFDPGNEYMEGEFCYETSITLEMYFYELRSEGYWVPPGVEIELRCPLHTSRHDRMMNRPEPWIVHVSHVSFENYAKIPELLQRLTDHKEAVEAMWHEMLASIEHMRHELQILCEVERELEDKIDRIHFGVDDDE